MGCTPFLEKITETRVRECLKSFDASVSVDSETALKNIVRSRQQFSHFSVHCFCSKNSLYLDHKLAFFEPAELQKLLFYVLA